MSHLTVNSYRTLHTLAQYLAILPRINPIGHKINSNGIRIVNNVLVQVLIYVYVAYARHKIFHEEMIATAYYGHVLSDILIVGCNIWNIINAHKSREIIARMLRSFDELSRTIKCVNSPKLQRISESFQRSCRIELMAIHVSCILYCALNFYEWSRFIGYEVAFVAALKDSMYYHIMVFAMVVRHFIYLIRYKVMCLKHVLRNISSPTKKCANCKHHLEFTLANVQNIFGIVNDIIVNFNKIYGSSIVGYIVNILVNIILPINMMMLYGGGSRELLGGRFDFVFIFVMFVLMLFPAVLGLALLSAGQQTINEIKEIPKICYLLGQKVDIITKLQLHEFASQVVNLNPQFDASGYFIVNYGVFTSMFSAIVSYIVVLIQFNNLN